MTEQARTLIEYPLQHYPKGCQRTPDEPMWVSAARNRAEHFLPHMWPGRRVLVRRFIYDDAGEEVVDRPWCEGRLTGRGIGYDCWDQATCLSVVFPDNQIQHHDVETIEIVDPDQERVEIEKGPIHPDHQYDALRGRASQQRPAGPHASTAPKDLALGVSKNTTLKEQQPQPPTLTPNNKGTGDGQ